MSNWRNCSEDQERFHIDSGPRPISALQVVSEALDIPSQHSQQQQDDSSQDHHGLIQQSESTGDYNCTKTIVASDSDVSNGFVKSGSSLPYVFEASESGSTQIIFHLRPSQKLILACLPILQVFEKDPRKYCPSARSAARGSSV